MMSNISEVLSLASEGFRLFPVTAKDKKPPLLEDWPNQASDDEEHIKFWAKRWPGCNWGLACGAGSGVLGIDFDGEDGRATKQRWVEQYGPEWADTREDETARGGHLFFLWPDGETKIRNSVRIIAPGVDVRGEGGYLIVPPSIHPDGPTYRWVGDPAKRIREAPAWLVELILQKAGPASPSTQTNGDGNDQGVGIPEGQRNNSLTSIAGFMRRRGLDRSAILSALLIHNSTHCEPPLSEAEVRQIAKSVGRYPSSPETTDWGVTGKKSKSNGQATKTAAEPEPVNWTEDDLTHKFTATYPDFRYVAPWGKWMRNAGGVWREDSVLSVFDRARGICREVSGGIAPKETGTLKYLRSAKTRAAVENMARSAPRHAATVSQWDMDARIMNTPDGTCELRTGVLREHRAEDYLTKATAVAPKNAEAPLWTSFLDRITAGDVELQRYLQSMAGYCLTGDTSEHVFFFLYGTGANGKGVFTSTLHGILADYAQVAEMAVFTENKNDRHPTELAALRGARLVIASEIDAGRRLAEGRVKSLTGGDPIRARFCRCDEFEFIPAFKLMLAGNHKPALRSVDEAIRRRVHMVPFVVTIPPEERDLKLSEKLRAEWPQILQWAINGCLAWQSEGLNPPAAVRDATEEYLSAEDAILTWLADRAIVSPQAGTTKTSVLYQDFKAWAETTGEFCSSQKRFSQDLKDRGFVIRESHGKVIDGIVLRRKEPS